MSSTSDRQAVYDIRDYGAVGDGATLDTQAIQAAIEACTSNNGGTVLVPAGRFVTGMLRVRDNVTLHLETQAVLLGSTNLADYAKDIARCGFERETHIDKCLIYAENAENIAITGRGTIDGQGAAFRGAAEGGAGGERPMLTRCYRARNILFDGVTLKNAGSWCSQFRECTDVRVTGVTIDSRVCWNNDGIDLMSSSRVRISDCTIICLDDAICFQNMSNEYPVEDIVITNCIMSTRWAAIRSGGAHAGGIRNVTVSNCVIRDTFGCGIKLQISGNGMMESMAFSNIVMPRVSCPISLRFGNCHYNGETRDEGFPWGGMRNILFNNIWASVVDEATLRREVKFPELYPGEERQCMSICGIPGHPVEGVTLSDVHFLYPGGGTKEDAANLSPPELEDQYPEYFMWGVLPAYGLYARHARALALSNVRFELAGPDARPAVVLDDVEDFSLANLRARGGPDAEALVRLRGVRQAFIRGCSVSRNAPVFLRVEGSSSAGILLSGNDLRGARSAVELAASVDPKGVREQT